MANVATPGPQVRAGSVRWLHAHEVGGGIAVFVAVAATGLDFAPPIAGGGSNARGSTPVVFQVERKTRRHRCDVWRVVCSPNFEDIFFLLRRADRPLYGAG